MRVFVHVCMTDVVLHAFNKYLPVVALISTLFDSMKAPKMDWVSGLKGFLKCVSVSV